jgi:hypothetical protein
MVYSSISDGKGPAKVETSKTFTRGGDGYSETHQAYANSDTKVQKVMVRDRNRVRVRVGVRVRIRV